MKLFSISLALLAVLAVPVHAQGGGMANRGAPTISQGIEFQGGAKLSIRYTALNWAQGRFMERVTEERFRNQINEQAKENPVGSVELSGAMQIGGKKVEAGKYGLHFLLSDEGKWILTLSKKDSEGDLELTQWPLALEETKDHAQRLSLVVKAGKESNESTIDLHFGDQHTSIPASVATDDDEK